MKPGYLLLALVLAGCSTGPDAPAPPLHGPAERPAVRGRGFVLPAAGTAFRPIGFNYDHDESGRLIEDYWEGEWPKIEEDFAEMRDLGANVVRIHLQFGRFMEAADRPKAPALDRLEKLLDLSERLGLRLDLTGLGCYHKADVPPWYDALDEAGRWEAQAAFWTAVASRCRARPAIFCYDLMNEPVVPGDGDVRADWLGPPFGGPNGSCFVQFVTRSCAGRKRGEVAVAWLKKLSAVVRAADPGALVTCGFTDWSLDKPGLTTGFTPALAAPELDFLCVHIYPERGKLDEALATVAAFAVPGVPVLLEETFPLKASPADLESFLEKSGDRLAGLTGFYWGATEAECRAKGTIAGAITADWLALFRKLAARKN